MNYDIKTKIFYPFHGAGWIHSRKTIEFSGQRKEYLEFKFINNPLTVSTPIDSLANLNIREITDMKKIEKLISVLKKTPMLEPPTEDYNKFIDFIKVFDNAGNIEGFIKIIQYCSFVKKKREEEKRVIPTNITKYIKTAVDYLTGEIGVSLDIDYEKASSKFYEITNIEAL